MCITLLVLVARSNVPRIDNTFQNVQIILLATVFILIRGFGGRIGRRGWWCGYLVMRMLLCVIIMVLVVGVLLTVAVAVAVVAVDELAR